MIRTKEEALAAFQRDLARWRMDLTVLEAGGYGKTGTAKTVRRWVHEMERIVEQLLRVTT